MPDFEAFPKIPRLNRNIIITEKIDGTNAAIGITLDGEVYAQSRSRIITPADDNMGFARYVDENKDMLRTLLGEGIHYGEWWGRGIQRHYNLPGKRFSLFQATRWRQDDVVYTDILAHGLDVVPILYEGPWHNSHGQFAPDAAIEYLRQNGSVAAPGFPNPEGIVVWHSASRTLSKVTLERDASHKSE